MAATRSRAAAAAGAAPSSSAAALLSILVYLFSGPCLILLNNRILNGYGFKFPIALSALGVIFSALVCRSLVWLGFAPKTRPELCLQGASFWRTTAPLALLAAATLALGNSAYVHLSVATCQILKALTPAMTLAMLYALQVEPPSLSVAGCVAAICFGTLLASRGELTMSIVGLALQLSANLAEAFRVVLSQRLLASQQLPLVEMQYHVAPYQALCLCAASLLVELAHPADRALAAATIAAHPSAFAVASVLGLGLQVTTLLVIKFAGSVTVKLLAIFRNAVLVLFQVAVGAEVVTSMQLTGHAISTASFIAYTYARMQLLPSAWSRSKTKAKKK